MSSKKEKICQLMIVGYSRSISSTYGLIIPSEIVSIIFMFYFIKPFNIKYGTQIKVEGNTITNICNQKLFTYKNTTVINDWMDPDSYTNPIHTIKMGIIKQFSGAIIIVIVEQDYDSQLSMNFIKGYAFSFYRHGEIYYSWHQVAQLDDYNVGDIISLTLNLKLLSLSYNIFNDGDIEFKEEGVLLPAGAIPKTKYKWAVGINTKGDCVEIVDVYSNK